MPIRTRINSDFIETQRWHYQFASLAEIEAEAGLSPGYLSRLLNRNGGFGASIRTTDAIYNAFEKRASALGRPVPDPNDFIGRMLVHEYVPEDEETDTETDTPSADW